MKIDREVWLAEDSNGDMHYFFSKPQKQSMPSGFFWVSQKGHIVPFRGFEPELSRLAESKSVDLKNTPLLLTLSMEG